MRSLLTALAVLSTLALTPILERRPTPADDDGRAGTVIDRQGLATWRAADRRRWTPLGRDDVLLPGDLVRTDVRGANAVEIALAGDSSGSLLIGPGALIELGRRELRILRGACEIAPGNGQVKVRGPDGFERDFDDRAIVRAADGVTTVLDAAPRWLTGYRESTTAEWMGSLVASVDGRDVTLAIDRHHVDVVVRDQVAETTVDQDYLNGTDRELEGVFTFPLPPDASVSSFAMWVGGEMVEADIVERSRARAIYEDLKARKKDPGLLEWSGGNLFTARVWPIPAHGNKRIRIRYTQVLPLEGRTYRYATALRSDATRDHPVRDLAVRVQVASSRPLAGVRCASHDALVRGGDRTGDVEWSAENATPDRDFEVRVELADPAPVTVIDHARDGQGYFMVLLTPPGEDAGWARETVPDGDPIELVLIADTSGSMDQRARDAQRDLIAALLGMLGDEDRFRLLATDRDAVWFDAGPAAPGSGAEALAFLDARPSLGWSDLDLAFRTAFHAAADDATIVYVGDGMITTGDADAQAFATRLARLALDRDVRCHAVTTSNAFDAVALDAIAQVGGGSRRELGDDAPATAFGLLTDAFGPSLKDARVSFDGVRTARVYPQVHPNVPVGRQREVLGRFQATGEPQQGTVIVEGRLRGEPVRWTRDVVFGAGDQHASFLPRLWARRHADALLAEGPSPAARAEVVALSAEFGFMTPLTSFLVLEDDADRERYGVTRRVRMSDGERFFAEAREQSQRDTLRDALAAARTWRLSMREQALREIAGLGRDLYGWSVAVGWSTETGSDLFFMGSGRLRSVEGRSAGPSTPGPQFGLDRRALEVPFEAAASGAVDELADFDAGDDRRGFAEAPNDAFGEDFETTLGSSRNSLGRSVMMRKSGGRYRGPSDTIPPWFAPPQLGDIGSTFGFPALAGFQPRAPEPPAPDWPQAVIDALRSIDKRPALSALDQPLSIEVLQRTLHAPTGRLIDRARTRAMWSNGSWTVESRTSRGRSTTLEWLIAGRRGVLDRASGLGRSRGATPAEGAATPVELPAYATTDMIAEFRSYAVRVEREAGDEIVIELSSADPSIGRQRHRLTINRELGVLVRRETIVAGRVEQTVAVDVLDTAGGITFPARIVTTDADGRTVGVVSLSAATLDAPATAARIADARAEIERAIVIDAEDPELDTAFEAAHAGSARLEDGLRVTAFLLARGLHDAALERFDALVSPALRDVPGAHWLRLRALSASRRGTELADELTATATVLAAAGPGPDSVPRARALLSAMAAASSPDDRLALLDRLESCFRLEDEDRTWGDRARRALRADLLEAANRPEDALSIRSALAADDPADLGATLGAAQGERRLGRLDAAEARLTSARSSPERWTSAEFDSLCLTTASLLWDRHELDSLRALCRDWIAQDTGNLAPFDVRLTVDLFQGQEAAVLTTIRTLTERQLDIEGSDRDRAEVHATIGHLLGNAWNYSRRSLLETDVPLLDALARQLLATPAGTGFATRILADARFRATDAGRALLAELRTEITADRLRDIDPRRFLLLADRAVEPLEWTAESWATIRDAIQRRALTAADRYARDFWSGRLLRLADARADVDSALAFLRARLSREHGTDIDASIASELLHRLARRSWTAGIEAEMLELGARAVDAFVALPEARTAHAQVSRWLADELDRMRRAAALGDVAELEKLPRAERRTREKTARVDAGTGLATAFTTAARAAPAERAHWLALEGLCFAAEHTSGDRATTRDQALALFDAARELPADERFARILRERTSLALAHLAVRRGASPDLPDAILAAYRARAAAEPATLDWRAQEIRLLTALDRADDLRGRLAEWIEPNRIERTLRQIRARMRAETGDFGAAAADLLRVATDSWLPADAWEEVGRWQLVRGDDPAYERAVDARLEAMTPNELQSVAWTTANTEPRRLDDTGARALRAMMRKAEDPAGHYWSVRGIYAATKDFRALACLADGAVGHAPRYAYPFLQRAADVLELVHEEATLDELARALEGVPARSQTDRRALALLRFLAQARATMVSQGGQAHRDAAAAALADAVGDLDEVGDDERAPLAAALAAIPALTGDAARALRRAALETLLAAAPRGGDEELTIADALARTAWAEGAHDAAIDALGGALAHRMGRPNRGLPARSIGYVDRLIGWLGERGRFTQAERWLTDARDQLDQSDLRRPFEDRIDGLHAAALSAGGATSLGAGADLLHAAAERLIQRLRAAKPEYIDDLVLRVAALHVAAPEPVAAAATQSLLAFANDQLPALTVRAPRSADDLVRRIADSLTKVAGPVEGLRLYVRSCREEPAWHRRAGIDAWSRFDGTMSNLRVKSGQLPDDLHAEFRALVLAHLDQDLTSAGGQRASIWSQGHRLFWSELRGDYLTTARRVLELRDESGAVTRYVAAYLHDGLSERRDAVRALQRLEARGTLALDDHATLTDWLLELRDFEAAWRHVEVLLASRELVLDDRLDAIRALHGSGRADEARVMALNTEDLFTAAQRFGEAEQAMLADACRNARIHDLAARHYELAIRTRERAHASGPDNRLAEWYGQWANELALLERFDAGVEAAAAAVVRCGPDQNARRTANTALERVLRSIPDLDAWIARHDAEVAATGVDAPVIRKALGAVLADAARRPQDALAQYELARALQPNDTETHDRIVALLDQLGRSDDAARAVWRAVRIDPTDLGRIEDLADRLGRLDRADTAARAWTDLVEHRPQEAEGHAAFARHLEQRERFADAIDQWRQAVRTRPDDPTHLLGLASAQLRHGDRQSARATLEIVLAGTWEQRFADVKARATAMLRSS